MDSRVKTDAIIGLSKKPIKVSILVLMDSRVKT